MKIEFAILGNPVALKRHRTFRMGKNLIQVDPSKADKSDFLALAHRYAPDSPIDLPLKLSVVCFFGRPKSHYNKKGLKITSPIHHTSKPDADNLIKFVADALNGIFWKDDSCISVVECRKRYDEQPRTVIVLETI